MTDRPSTPFARHRARLPAFTLVEAIMAMALSSAVIVGLMSYFGFTLQGFSQQESTLTGNRDAQILLSYLRSDLTAADGFDSSHTQTSGTTFPKSELHLIQSLGSDLLQVYIHTRRSEPDIRPGDDPVLDPMPPQVRTSSWIKALAIPNDDPIHDFLPPGNPTNDMLRSLNYMMNAAAWVHPADPDEPRHFSINMREGPGTFPVAYTYFPKSHTVQRLSRTGTTLLAVQDVEAFSVSPCFEFLTDPARPGSTAELIRVFYEVFFALRAPQGGSKISKRQLTFSTRVTPKFLNGVIRSRWGL